MLIREGLYSRTSEDFQKMFSKVIKIVKNGLHKDEISLQYRIFNKTEDLRLYWEDRIDVVFTENMEVWGGFDSIKETLNLDNIKQKEAV
jgi:DNA recombination-dependent growth factor C